MSRDAHGPPRGAPPHRPFRPRGEERGDGNARALAALALARVLDGGARAQAALSTALDGSRLDERDRGLATELFYGALRFARPLEASLLRAATKPGRGLDARIRPHLLVAAYQLQHLGERIPAHAAVSAAVAAIKRERPGLEGFANALLRHLGSPMSAMLTSSSSLAERCAAWGVPLALGRAVTSSLPPDQHDAAIAGLQARPSPWAWFPAGTGSVTVDAGGVSTSRPAHPIVPACLLLSDGRLDDDSAAGCLVMDPSRALAALLTASSGQRVLDLCPGTGASAVVLADVVGPQGRVVVVEPDGKKAARIVEHGRRLGLETRLKVVAGAGADDGLAAVLVDVPGTGVGASRRQPEQVFRFVDADVAADGPIVSRQRALLAQAASLIRPGGLVVYSVTSPLPEEGEGVIDAFLADHPGFVVEPPGSLVPGLPAAAVDARGVVRLLPHRDDADAVFIARLRRRS
jgi:16S rRNA (cytosine967-C5)-methyltransferase